MLCPFGLLVSAPNKLRCLENRLFCRLGFLSYTAYLIHDSNGTLLINKYGGFLGLPSQAVTYLRLALFQRSPQVRTEFFNPDLPQTQAETFSDGNHPDDLPDAFGNIQGFQEE
jgi:hypothetical protein